MLEKITNIALLACALWIGFNILQSRKDKTKTPPDVTEEQWAALTSAASVLGPDDAQYEMVVFTDYECPFCRSFESVIDSTRVELGGNLRVVYRNLPLVSIHPNAFEAALASTCASAQRKFADFHAWLYDEAPGLSREKIVEVASAVEDLDPRLLIECMESDKARDAVESDIALANALGIDGTPSFLVRRHLVRGQVAHPQLVSMLTLDP